MHELSVSGYRNDGAGYAFGGDFAGEKIIQPGEALFENPTSSGFVSGNGAALAAPRAIPAIIVAIMATFFFIVSSQGDYFYVIGLTATGGLEHACMATESSAGGSE